MVLVQMPNPLDDSPWSQIPWLIVVMLEDTKKMVEMKLKLVALYQLLLVETGKNEELKQDMAAHSGCDFGDGKAEKLALAKYRQVIGLLLKTRFTNEELRHQGRCPLTPEEKLALAKYRQVYGGEARISVLGKLFPLIMDDNKSLASDKERADVEGKASLLAAVDYYVSMHTDIFISASPGNMNNAMLGYRAYKNLKDYQTEYGALTSQLFLNETMEWPEFQWAIQNAHKNRQGQVRLRKETQSIYTYPIPDCMCQQH